MMKLAAFLLSMPMLLAYSVKNVGRRETFLGSSRVVPLRATAARGSIEEGPLGMAASRFMMS